MNNNDKAPASSYASRRRLLGSSLLCIPVSVLAEAIKKPFSKSLPFLKMFIFLPNTTSIPEVTSLLGTHAHFVVFDILFMIHWCPVSWPTLDQWSLNPRPQLGE